MDTFVPPSSSQVPVPRGHRTSRLAVCSGIFSALVLGGFAAVFGLGTLAVGGVPVFGILALLVWVPAAAFVFLVLSAVSIGLSAAAAAHVNERLNVRGLPWTVFGRVAGGIGVFASIVILLGTVALPTFLIQQESAAWRQTANHGIASFEATSTKLAEIDASLEKGIDLLVAMSPDASPFDRAKIASLFSEQSARLQTITESLIAQSRSWQTALEMTLKNNGANATEMAKGLGSWLQSVWSQEAAKAAKAAEPKK